MFKDEEEDVEKKKVFAIRVDLWTWIIIIIENNHFIDTVSEIKWVIMTSVYGLLNI